MAILLLFVGAGLWGVQAANIAPAAWSPALELVAGGMIIFLAYEGFELIANAAQDVKDVARTLPRAYYIAVGSVIGLYVLVSLVTVGNLPVDQIVKAEDYALAAAAKPFLGQAGFALIAVAALLSTTSAINATLYGSARLSYSIATEGQLPEILERPIWGQPIVGLLISAGLTLLVANVLDLASVATLGSAGFLVIFAAVNAANVRQARETHSRAWVSALGSFACLAALGALVWHTLGLEPGRSAGARGAAWAGPRDRRCLPVGGSRDPTPSPRPLMGGSCQSALAGARRP